MEKHSFNELTKPQKSELEILKEGRDIKINRLERFGETKISNFESSEILSNNDIELFFRKNIPPSQLRNCPEITFGEQKANSERVAANVSEDHPRELRVRVIPKNTALSNREIRLLENVVEQVGKNVYKNLQESRPETLEHWLSINKTLGSRTTPAALLRDFTRSYKEYILSPSDLRVQAPGKYEILRFEVFGGREYKATVKEFIEYHRKEFIEQNGFERFFKFNEAWNQLSSTIKQACKENHISYKDNNRAINSLYKKGVITQNDKNYLHGLRDGRNRTKELNYIFVTDVNTRKLERYNEILRTKSAEEGEVTKKTAVKFITL